MSTTTASIDVKRPVRTVYNQWTQFETFPHFMEGVEEVVQQRDNTLAADLTLIRVRSSSAA